MKYSWIMLILCLTLTACGADAKQTTPDAQPVSNEIVIVESTPADIGSPAIVGTGGGTDDPPKTEIVVTIGAPGIDSFTTIEFNGSGLEAKLNPKAGVQNIDVVNGYKATYPLGAFGANFNVNVQPVTTDKYKVEVKRNNIIITYYQLGDYTIAFRVDAKNTRTNKVYEVDVAFDASVFNSSKGGSSSGGDGGGDGGGPGGGGTGGGDDSDN